MGTWNTTTPEELSNHDSLYMQETVPLELSSVSTKDKVVFCCVRALHSCREQEAWAIGGSEHSQSPRYHTRNKGRREKLQTSCLT
jgi:hypothetical protein